MTARLAWAARPLRAVAVTALVTGSVAVLGTGTAHANSSGVFIACADENSQAAVTVGHGCTTLAQALSSAVAYGARDTVELMPGDYCPVTLPTDFNDIAIVGVGAAGLAPADASYTGAEAALSSFDLDATTCGASSSFAFDAPGDAPQETGNVTLENIGLDGTAGGGPANGINAFDIGLTLQDVLVDNFRGTGLTFSADNTFIAVQAAKMSVSNSAFLNSLVGISFHGGSTYAGGSIDDSLIAGNVAGLQNTSSLNLAADTISHNSGGVDNSGSNSGGQTLNTIVGGNTTDCTGGGGAALEPVDEFNGDNLLGSSCAGGSPSNGEPDQVLSTAVAAVALVAGAPTPSITPPTQAIDGADGSCGGLDNTDQIEDPVPAGVICDIGAIQSQPTTTTPDAAADPASVSDGTVPVNQAVGSTIYLTNDGGKLVGASAVSVSGSSAFSVGDDSCTYRLLTHDQSDYCTVSVSARASGAGVTDHGDLIITTSANTIDIPLSIKGAAALRAPTGLVGVPGDGTVALTFTPPTRPSVQITGYDVQQSTDGGHTWSFASAEDDSHGVPTGVTGLTNGTSYKFEVAAEDAWGDGPWSSPSAAVIPHTGIDASALEAPAAITMKTRTIRSLTTTLIDHDTGTPIARAAITLTGGGKTTSAKTNADGVARVKVRPTFDTVYTWHYAGSSGHRAASAKVRVAVEQVVGASLSHPTVKRGRSVQVYGTVSPNEKGKTVVVQELVSGVWRTLPHDATIRSQVLPGRHHKVLGYIYTYTPTKKGKQTLRVSRGKTAKNAAGVSKHLKLTVT